MSEVFPRFKVERAPKPRKRMRRVGKKMTRDRRELIESKAQVLLRSKGRCEAKALPHVCEGLASQFHHVKRRSQGGDNSPENLVHCCTPAHMRIHAMPDLAKAAGLLA